MGWRDLGRCLFCGYEREPLFAVAVAVAMGRTRTQMHVGWFTRNHDLTPTYLFTSPYRRLGDGGSAIHYLGGD